jgi:hypothetical protein
VYFQLYLQMLLIYEQILQVQLQKTCFVAPEKKLTVGGIFVVLYVGVISKCKSDISKKLDVFGYVSVYFVFNHNLLINVNILSFQSYL